MLARLARAWGVPVSWSAFKHQFNYHWTWAWAWTPDKESNAKRAQFRNLIQLIRLTTTILSKGEGPKLHEPAPSPYASGPYTYLDAAARLLVRKDEVIAAAGCTSFRKDSPNDHVEFEHLAQPSYVPVVVDVSMFTFSCSILLTTMISPRWQATISGMIIPRALGMSYLEHT